MLIQFRGFDKFADIYMRILCGIVATAIFLSTTSILMAIFVGIVKAMIIEILQKP